jgi:hypothetical protein
MEKTLDWKRAGDGALCAAAGMFHLRVWQRLSEDWKFTVTNPIGDVYEGVRPDEALAIADAHHAAELLSGGVL